MSVLFYSGAESCSGQKSEEDSAKESSKIEESKEENYLWKVETVEDKESVHEIVEEEIQEMEREEEKLEKHKKAEKRPKPRKRPKSVESRSKMAAFLPSRQLWAWSGKGYRKPRAKGKVKRLFFNAIQRGTETIKIGDSAVFLSTAKPERPYIGKIDSMWETLHKNKIVKVNWFYHPDETIGCPDKLKYDVSC